MTTCPDERILAVDGGTRRVGLALGHRGLGLATPHSVIERNPGAAGLVDLVRRVADLAAEEDVDRIVVGLPLNMDGSEGPAARAARELGRALEGATGRPVTMVDERLTSEAAQERARASGWTPRSGRPIDDVAAAVLLESWFLDERTGAAAARHPRDEDETHDD